MHLGRVGAGGASPAARRSSQDSPQQIRIRAAQRPIGESVTGAETSSWKAERSHQLLFILVATLFLSQWNLQGPGGLTLNFTKVFGILTGAFVFGSTMQRQARHNRPWRVPWRPLALVALLVSFDLFGVIFALAAGHDPLPFVIQQAGALLWVCTPLLVLRSARALRSIMIAYCIAAVGVHLGIILTSTGLLHIQFGTQAHQRVVIPGVVAGATRSAGFITNFGEVAIITSFALPWMVNELVRNGVRRSVRLAIMIAIPIMAIGSIMSLSRNVWLSSAVALGVFAVGYVVVEAPPLKRIAMVLVAAIAVGVFSSVLWRSMREAVAAMAAVREQSIQSRATQYRIALHQITQGVFAGRGPNSRINGLPVHNLFLNAALTAGVGGLFLIVAVLWVEASLLREASRRRSRSSLVFAAGFTGAITASMFYPVLESSAPIFWLTLGIAASATESGIWHTGRQ